jgi:hypothetical protein
MLFECGAVTFFTTVALGYKASISKAPLTCLVQSSRDMQIMNLLLENMCEAYAIPQKFHLKTFKTFSYRSLRNMHIMHVKGTILWVVKPYCSKKHDVSEAYITSVFTVKAKQVTSINEEYDLLHYNTV